MCSIDYDNMPSGASTKTDDGVAGQKQACTAIGTAEDF